MSKWIAGHTCAAAVLAVAMVGAQSSQQEAQPAPTPGSAAPAAQTPGDPAPQQPATPRPTTGQGTMTLSGCVTNSAGTGGSAAVPAPGAAPMIVLTTSSEGASSTRSEVAGTSGSPTAATARGTQYRLSGSNNLDQYVGKRVEVVGSRTAATGTSGSAASAAGASAGITIPVEFRVTSVRVLDESCK